MPVAPLTEGDSRHSMTEMQYRLEVAFDADAASAAGARSSDRAGSMLGWQPLLPPLAAAINFGAGNTPLADGSPVTARPELDGGSTSRMRARIRPGAKRDRLHASAASAAALSGAAGVVAGVQRQHRQRHFRSSRGRRSAQMCAKASAPLAAAASLQSGFSSSVGLRGTRRDSLAAGELRLHAPGEPDLRSHLKRVMPVTSDRCRVRS